MNKLYYRLKGQFADRNLLSDTLLKFKWSITFTVSLLFIFLFFLSEHINVLFSLLNILFIFLVFILVGKIRPKFLRYLTGGLLILLLSFNITFSIVFSVPLSLGNIASILEANISEILAINWEIFLLGVLCLLTTTMMVKKVISELNSKISGKRAGAFLLILLFLVNIVTILIPVWRNSDFIKGYKKDLEEMPVQTIYAFSSLRLPLLYGDIFALAVYSIEKLDFQKFKNEEKKLSNGILLDQEKVEIPKIYLVIGESAWRERMSLYGYSIPTTPFLDSIKRIDSSSIHYYDGVAIANMTRDAVRFSLSFATPRDKEAFWREKNVVEMAKDAGYNTLWLSNQGQAGIYDNYPSYIARSSDYTFFESSLDKDDLNLLLKLEELHEKDESQLLVMHLIGSHFPYMDRSDNLDDSYFDHFDSISEYDKSIYHTDRFLKKLYNYTIKEDSSSIIVYYSDHGASPDRGVHGLRGFRISEYQIPLIILKNNIGRDIHAIVSKYLSGGSDQYVNNSNLSYILSELMGYKVSPNIVASAVKNGEEIMLVDGSLDSYELLRKTEK